MRSKDYINRKIHSLKRFVLQNETKHFTETEWKNLLFFLFQYTPNKLSNRSTVWTRYKAPKLKPWQVQLLADDYKLLEPYLDLTRTPDILANLANISEDAVKFVLENLHLPAKECRCDYCKKIFFTETRKKFCSEACRRKNRYHMSKNKTNVSGEL